MLSQAFPPKNRLHYSWEYRLFFKKSEMFKLSECVVYRIPNQLGCFRLGITIKSRGSSVERNRVKRQLREKFRTHASCLGSFDYNVVIPAYRKMKHPYAFQLAQCLENHFLKQAILKTSSFEPS